MYRKIYSHANSIRVMMMMMMMMISAVRALIFLERRIQPFISSLVDRQVEILCYYYYYYYY